MLADFRNAWRALRAAPGFTAVAVAVLTLGIGASTAIFSVVDAVVLRGLPFDQADRLVVVGGVPKTSSVARPGSETAPTYLDWRGQQDIFEGLGASSSTGGFTIREGGQPEDLRVQRITANLMPLLRVAPRIGQSFTADNEVDGNHRVAIISDGLWRRRFSADPAAIGKTMTFDSGVWQIVGVMAPGFTYPMGQSKPTDMWIPYVVPERERLRGNSRGYYLQLLGRLKSGITIEQAQVRMTQVNASLAQQYPKWYAERGVAVRTLVDAIVGDQVRSWMLMLLGAVAFVLVIACVNVANLMLARATARGREIGIRAALGATRWQLARGLLVESFVLSAAGTACGVLLAWWGVAMLRAALPASLPRIAAIGIDMRVLAAAVVAAIATGVAFGLVPALQFSRPDLAGSLREGGRSGTAGVVKQRLRTGLLVAEVGLAVILLVGAGLFVSSFVRLMHIDVGLDYHNILTVGVYPKSDFSNKESIKDSAARAAQLVPAVLDRVRAIPGVEVAAALHNGLPLSGSWSRTSVTVPGHEGEFEGDNSVDIREVSTDYLKAVRVPLLRGRQLTDADTRASEPVILLNDVAAKKYFGDRDPIGQSIGINGTRTIVGIVGSIRLGGPETEVRPESYKPMSQNDIYGADLVLRTKGDPMAIAPAVKAAIWSVAPDLSIPEAQSLEDMFNRLVAQRRFNMMLLSLFGLLAVVIASVGIYGVMAYIVEQRTQEIGVRMALGALPGGILRMVLGRATIFMAAGLAIGLAGAWALASVVKTFLFQVPPHDVIVYGVVALILGGVGLVAAFVPALRAARVDPLVALRTE